MLVESTICTTYLSKGSCSLGNSCPKRHVPLFQPPPSSASHNRDGLKRTVCKHWLRGLCKKGDGCDYLHEYDMRTMPECRFFATFGFCDQAGGGTDRECLYLHRDPKTKRRECEEYRRGFCPKGELECSSHAVV
jgi:cleavage and polyadenylation specificity factor subunit 4